MGSGPKGGVHKCQDHDNTPPSSSRRRCGFFATAAGRGGRSPVIWACARRPCTNGNWPPTGMMGANAPRRRPHSGGNRTVEAGTMAYYKSVMRGPSARESKDESLKRVIKEIHEKSRGTYGSPRIHAELRMGRGIRCSRKRVVRLMRQLKIQGASRRGRFGCTRRDPKKEAYPDLVDRRFVAERPDNLWVADITQHPTAQGFLYIAVLIDVFSQMVVG